MDWIQRVESIRQWTKVSTRAPHKPLLLLYALANFQRHGEAPIRFVEAKNDLKRLLAEFGPPNPTSLGYPFHHLASDGLGEVHTRDRVGSPGSNIGDLTRADATGYLSPDLVEALNNDSHLLAQLARTLLDANFAQSLHIDICETAGLDLESAELPSTARPSRESRLRSAQFRKDVLTAYEYQCTFCGYDGILSGTPVALDAAHIRWWAFDGPDTVANGLCLCVLHHKLFDKGALGLSEDHRVTVSVQFIGRSSSANHQVLTLLGIPARSPQRGFSAPEAEHLDWHRSQVFRAPTRQANP